MCRAIPTVRAGIKGRKYWAVGLFGVIVAMNGLAYATVPAYRAFCQQFGFAGIPLVDNEAPAAGDVIDRRITVRFNADVGRSLDWRFKPAQTAISLQVGETGIAFYEAINRHDRPVTGSAVFNVTPLKAAPYFVKIACFCFEEQTLEPGQAVDMPVTFFVDPAIAEDRGVDDVQTITLSYTFFEVPASRSEGRRASGAAAMENDASVE